MVFLWPTAHEIGLRGSTWFVENPTIRLEAIAAVINLDMIGRGNQTIHGRRPLEVLGARQRSTELGDLVGAVNGRSARPFWLDYSRDGSHEGSLPFCRGDGYSFAVRGTPVVFFTTGLHLDYHRVTDEAQYINFEYTAAVTNFVRSLVIDIANRQAPARKDRPALDATQSCRMDARR